MKKREGDNIENWLRSSRFYSLKGGWYFSTREGVDFGPFPSRDAALKEFEDFVARSGDKPQPSLYPE